VSVSCTSAMVSARFALDPLGPRSNALHALARGWMRGLRHNLRHTLVWWEADFRPRRGLGFLRLLRPSCSGCLLCAFGSLSRSHALGGIGPALLSATDRAVFDDDQPGIGMNRAMLCHNGIAHAIIISTCNRLRASRTLLLLSLTIRAKFGFSTEPFVSVSHTRPSNSVASLAIP